MGLAVACGTWLSGEVGGKVEPVAAAGIPVGCVTSDGTSLLGVTSGTLGFGPAVGIGGAPVGLVVGRGWSFFDVDCGLQTFVTNGDRMSKAGSVNSLKKSLGNTNGERSLGTLISKISGAINSVKTLNMSVMKLSSLYILSIDTGPFLAYNTKSQKVLSVTSNCI